MRQQLDKEVEKIQDKNTLGQSTKSTRTKHSVQWKRELESEATWKKESIVAIWRKDSRVLVTLPSEDIGLFGWGWFVRPLLVVYMGWHGLMPLLCQLGMGKSVVGALLQQDISIGPVHRWLDKIKHT